jgi:hypothetical protein
MLISIGQLKTLFQNSKNQISTQKPTTFTIVTAKDDTKKNGTKNINKCETNQNSLEQHNRVCHSAKQFKRTIFQQQFFVK